MQVLRAWHFMDAWCRTSWMTSRTVAIAATLRDALSSCWAARYPRGLRKFAVRSPDDTHLIGDVFARLNGLVIVVPTLWLDVGW